MEDTFGRTITYLRLSVTDLCNYRCCYCMAPEGMEKTAHGAVCSLEELRDMTAAAVACGVRKVRITGGEPLELMIRSLDPYMVRANNNILSRQFAEKLNAVPGLTEAKRQEYLEAHQTALKESFIPAYRTLSQGLEELQEAAAANGICLKLNRKKK